MVASKAVASHFSADASEQVRDGDSDGDDDGGDAAAAAAAAADDDE